jgi:hypothetical protein
MASDGNTHHKPRPTPNSDRFDHVETELDDLRLHVVAIDQGNIKLLELQNKILFETRRDRSQLQHKIAMAVAAVIEAKLEPLRGQVGEMRTEMTELLDLVRKLK